jgi:hypothetical protein
MADYVFGNMARIGADKVDNTQRNLYNTRFANYTLSNYYSDSTSDNHVQFATQNPSINLGQQALNGSLVDIDSMLLIKTEQERSLEKLSLNQRAFLTVPYLGKGSCNTLLETQLLMGENSHESKSVGTIMNKSFMDYSLYPLDKNMEECVKTSKHSIEEVAMDGWVRGGVLTREMENDKSQYSQESRPNLRF